MVNTCKNRIDRLNAMNGALPLKEITDGCYHTMTELIVTEDDKCCMKIGDAWYATNSNTVVRYMSELYELYTDDEIHNGISICFEKRLSRSGREFTMPVVTEG